MLFPNIHTIYNKLDKISQNEWNTISELPPLNECLNFLKKKASYL